MSFILFYVPKNTFLHRLPLIAKLCVLFFYVLIVFLSRTVLTVLCLCFFLAITTLVLRLPLRNWHAIFVFLLLVSIPWPFATTLVMRFSIAFGKIICLMLGLNLFSMTTKLSEFLVLTQLSSSVGSVLRQLIYIINLILTVLPSVQYDLQRAIDAETIRRGRSVKFFSLQSWMTILTVVLVRASLRGERLAETIIDRGYLLEKGLTPLRSAQLQAQDMIWTTLIIIPGLIIFILTSRN